jgi:hypothetical protein
VLRSISHKSYRRSSLEIIETRRGRVGDWPRVVALPERIGPCCEELFPMQFGRSVALELNAQGMDIQRSGRINDSVTGQTSCPM